MTLSTLPWSLIHETRWGEVNPIWWTCNLTRKLYTQYCYPITHHECEIFQAVAKPRKLGQGKKEKRTRRILHSIRHLHMVWSIQVYYFMKSLCHPLIVIPVSHSATVIAGETKPNEMWYDYKRDKYPQYIKRSRMQTT